MTNWIIEQILPLMASGEAAVLHSFYAHGTGGSYRLIFEPKDFSVWSTSGVDSYKREAHALKYGWESQIGMDNTYMEYESPLTLENLEAVTAQIIEDWTAVYDSTCAHVFFIKD